MHWFLFPIAALLGALGRRVAGGVLSQWFNWNAGDVCPRIFFGLTVGVSFLLGGAIWWHCLVIALVVFLGCSIPNKFTTPWGPVGSIALGRDGTQSWMRSAIGLEAHGVLAAIAPAVLTFFGHYSLWYLFLIAGASIVPLYELGWRITGPSSQPKFPNVLRLGCELGEAFYGASLATAAFFVA